MGKILVIGGANIDILGISSHHLISKDSNPGKIHVTFGGVGRNIAENCCNLKQNTIFVSVIGNDANGQRNGYSLFKRSRRNVINLHGNYG